MAESRPRGRRSARGRDVEERVPVRGGDPHADHRTEGPRKNKAAAPVDEVRAGSPPCGGTRREVVAELVGAEDQEQTAGEGTRSGATLRSDTPQSAPASPCREERAGDERRQAGQENSRTLTRMRVGPVTAASGTRLHRDLAVVASQERRVPERLEAREHQGALAARGARPGARRGRRSRGPGIWRSRTVITSSTFRRRRSSVMSRSSVGSVARPDRRRRGAPRRERVCAVASSRHALVARASATRDGLRYAADRRSAHHGRSPPAERRGRDDGARSPDPGPRDRLPAASSRSRGARGRPDARALQAARVHAVPARPRRPGLGAGRAARSRDGPTRIRVNVLLFLLTCLSDARRGAPLLRHGDAGALVAYPSVGWLLSGVPSPAVCS